MAKLESKLKAALWAAERGRLGWWVGAKPANIFPPNYTGQVAMMVSRSIKGNFQSRLEIIATQLSFSSSWLVYFVTKFMGIVLWE